jgi:hypothetical protein
MVMVYGQSDLQNILMPIADSTAASLFIEELLILLQRQTVSSL